MKNIWKKVKRIIINLIKEYPVTIITGMLCSLICSIFIDSNMDGELLARIVVFLLFLALGSFLGENYFIRKRKRIITYIIACAISVFLTILIFASTANFGMWAFKLGISYFFIVSILTFYKLYKKSGISLGHYLVKILSGSLVLGIIENVLSMGLLAVSMIFSFLLLGDDGFDLVWRIQILLLGFFCLPGGIYVLVNKDIKPFDFLKAIVHYIMESLVFSAFIVIYLYMIRIFISWEIPSNQIFRILAVLFIVSLPIWIMNTYYEDKTFFTKLNHYLPIAFIPFIFLEAYSLGIRLLENGLTNIRYIGIMILILQTTYLILYLFKKDKLYLMIYISIGLIIVTFLVPHYNMIELSNINQTNRLLKYLDKEKLTSSETESIISSYEYVMDNFNGKEYLDAHIGDKREKLSAILENAKVSGYDNIYYIDGSINDPINISGYDVLKTFDKSWYAIENNENISIMVDEVNIIPIILDYIDNHDLENYVKTHYEYTLGNKKIIFSNIYIRYNASKNIFNDLQLKGYILER